jgi:hypothetical protein
VDAAALLRLSYRHTKPLWKRYREERAAGLKHRSPGRRSNRAYAEGLRRKVLGPVREKYSGPAGEHFGPTLAAEHLASEDRLKIAAETLRRWMLQAGLWSRERRRRRHRRRRERKEHFGELVQMDGSFHPWPDERGPQGCLMDLVDDATNTTLARLREEETIWAAAGALRAWVERYGVPRALYVDWKNLYKRWVTVVTDSLELPGSTVSEVEEANLSASRFEPTDRPNRFSVLQSSNLPPPTINILPHTPPTP